MAGLDHSKLFFAGMGYGSFIYDANWDLKGAKWKKFRKNVQFYKTGTQLFGRCRIFRSRCAVLTEVGLKIFFGPSKNFLSPTSVKKWHIRFEK